MRVLRPLIDFLFYGNVFIALAAAFLCYAYQSGNLGLGGAWGCIVGSDASLFVFYSTFSIYNLQRVLFLRSEHDHNERSQYLINNRVFLSVVSGLAALGALYEMMSFSLPSIKIVLFAIIVSLAYITPIGMGRMGVKKIRELPLIKIILVGLAWAISCVLLPASQYVEVLSPAVLADAAIVFLFIVAITIPFDIRDHWVDKSAGVQTIVSVFGERNAKLIGIGMLVIALLIDISTNSDLESNSFTSSIMRGSIFLLSGLLIWKSNRNRAELYYLCVIDGMIFLFAAGYLLH